MLFQAWLRDPVTGVRWNWPVVFSARSMRAARKYLAGPSYAGQQVERLCILLEVR